MAAPKLIELYRSPLVNGGSCNMYRIEGVTTLKEAARVGLQKGDIDKATNMIVVSREVEKTRHGIWRHRRLEGRKKKPVDPRPEKFMLTLWMQPVNLPAKRIWKDQVHKADDWRGPE